MSRSFLSYRVDFRPPYESQILRKSREKKSGRSHLGAYLGLFRLIPILVWAYSGLFSPYFGLFNPYLGLSQAYFGLFAREKTNYLQK